MRSVNERTGGTLKAVQAAMESVGSSLRVALPGIIRSWDAETQTVSVQPAINERMITGGQETEVQIPLLVDVPVVMPRAGGYSLVFAPRAGDECLVVFADSCIDSWWQSGGVQAQAESRRHDLSDGFAILGCWSQPNKPFIPQEGVRLQNDNGSAGISIVGGAVNIFGSVQINGAPYGSHKHSGVTVGSGVSGGISNEGTV